MGSRYLFLRVHSTVEQSRVGLEIERLAAASHVPANMKTVINEDICLWIMQNPKPGEQTCWQWRSTCGTTKG